MKQPRSARLVGALARRRERDGRRTVRAYPEGIGMIQPRVGRAAAYPGGVNPIPSTLKELNPARPLRMDATLSELNEFALTTQGRPLRGQPWAESWNPVGILIAALGAALLFGYWGSSRKWVGG